jgi:hypothetical protein
LRIVDQDSVIAAVLVQREAGAAFQVACGIGQAMRLALRNLGGAAGSAARQDEEQLFIRAVDVIGLVLQERAVRTCLAYAGNQRTHLPIDMVELYQQRILARVFPQQAIEAGEFGQRVLRELEHLALVRSGRLGDDAFLQTLHLGHERERVGAGGDDQRLRQRPVGLAGSQRQRAEGEQ